MLKAYEFDVALEHEKDYEEMCRRANAAYDLYAYWSAEDGGAGWPSLFVVGEETEVERFALEEKIIDPPHTDGLETFAVTKRPRSFGPFED